MPKMQTLYHALSKKFRKSDGLFRNILSCLLLSCSSYKWKCFERGALMSIKCREGECEEEFSRCVWGEAIYICRHCGEEMYRQAEDLCSGG